MRCVDDCKYREMLDDANADLQELKAEYDRLREYVEHERGVKEFVRVMAENSKLREMVRDVHKALCADKVCMFHKLILASMEDDMRELGIEVE